MRSVLAIAGSYLLWTVCWLGGNALFFADLGEKAQHGIAVTALLPLLALLGQSLVCSLIAGYVCAWISPERRNAWILGLLLLATGLPVQASAWHLMPLWYHLCFLFLLVPATLLGAWRKASP
jgi:hypothetical protein